MRRAAALALLAFVAGCGDEGGDKATYVKSGDRICNEYANDIAKLGQPDSLTEIGPYVTKAMPVLEKAVGRIEKLDPPSDLADEFEKFRDVARATVDRAERLQTAAAAGDSVEVQDLLDEAAKASQTRKGLADAAGLKACAKL